MTALTDAELAEIEIIAHRHQADRRPEEHGRLMDAIPSIVSELRDARAVDDQIRERLAFLDQAIADGRFPEPKTVCAHCQAEHDVESGAMAAHVRECDRNPMVAELRSLRGEAERMRAVVEAADEASRCLGKWMPSSDAAMDLCDRIDAAVDAYRAAKETGR